MAFNLNIFELKYHHRSFTNSWIHLWKINELRKNVHRCCSNEEGAYVSDGSYKNRNTLKEKKKWTSFQLFSWAYICMLIKRNYRGWQNYVILHQVLILTACFRVDDIFVATLLPSGTGPPTLSQVCIITNTSSTPIPITKKYYENFLNEIFLKIHSN